MDQPTVKNKGRPRGPAGTRAFYQVDTKGTCLICLRVRDNIGNRKENIEISSKFSRILLRHLKLDFHRNIVSPSKFKWKPNRVKKVGIELCEDCSLLASSFSDMYCQLECIQMKVNACVKTISDIMKIAGRLPSRLKTFQERNGIVKKEPGLANAPASTPKAALLAKNFRREVIQKSVESLKRTLPLVKLSRCGTNLSAHPFHGLTAKSIASARKTSAKTDTSNILYTPPLIQTQFRRFLLAYVISFVTVWLLGTPSLGKCVPDMPGATLSVAPCAIEDESVTTSAESICGDSSSMVAATSSADKPSEGKQTSKSFDAVPSRKNSITITDSGKMVLLPHQTFKTEEEFVDESIMEYEDNIDLVDISDDRFFASGNDSTNDINITPEASVSPLEVVKQEPQESLIELNDRTCTECRIHLSCRAELEKHRSLIHKWGNHVQCPVCKTMFPSYHFLKNHRKDTEACALDEAMEALEFTTIAKPIFPYCSTVRGNRFCPMEGCFEVFLKHDNLQMHLKAHGMFTCSHGECKEKFDKAHDLALHETYQHSSGVQFSGYKCARCNFHVGGQYQYILHFLGEHLHISVFTEQCNICRKGFLRRKGPLLIKDKDLHFQLHHDVKDKDPKTIVRCDMDNCEAFFLKKQQLTTHKTIIHHVEPDAKLSCSICGEKMLNQAILRKHRLQAHSNLAAHEIDAKIKRRMNTGIKKGKYNCMYCGNQYSSKYSLLIHGKVHDHLKNYVVEEELNDDKTKETTHSTSSSHSVQDGEKSNDSASSRDHHQKD